MIGWEVMSLGVIGIFFRSRLSNPTISENRESWFLEGTWVSMSRLSPEIISWPRREVLWLLRGLILDEFYFRWLGNSVIEIGKAASIPLIIKILNLCDQWLSLITWFEPFKKSLTSHVGQKCHFQNGRGRFLVHMWLVIDHNPSCSKNLAL